MYVCNVYLLPAVRPVSYCIIIYQYSKVSSKLQFQIERRPDQRSTLHPFSVFLNPSSSGDLRRNPYTVLTLFCSSSSTRRLASPRLNLIPSPPVTSNINPRLASNQFFAMMMLAHLQIFALLFSTVVATSRTNKASFVPPASPLLTSSRARYGLYADTKLSSKKKAAAAVPKKFQVKMLKYVEGTGLLGEVVMVTPAFFNNKLKPTKSAEIISDQEVQKDLDETRETLKAQNAAANAVLEDLEDFVMVISRKAGPDGQLFGGIGPKCIMEELSNKLPKDVWAEKGVRVTAVMDENGTKMKGDIKHIGKFSATICLTKEISGKFPISIEEES